MQFIIKKFKLKQKYKGINPILLRKLELLDNNHILCQYLRELISKFKFVLPRKELFNLKLKILKNIHNTTVILKIIQKFIKNSIKNRYLVINFELHFYDYFIEVNNNKINLCLKENSENIGIENESDEENIINDIYNDEQTEIL